MQIKSLVWLCISEGGPNLHNGSLGKFCDQDPLVETYTSMDIEAMLGLQQKHMVALALLIGCDYDLKGVEGIGCSHAMRFVRSFPEAEILDRSGFLHVPNLWLARTRSLLMQQYWCPHSLFYCRFNSVLSPAVECQCIVFQAFQLLDIRQWQVIFIYLDWLISHLWIRLRTWGRGEGMSANNMEMASYSSSESEGEKDHQKICRKLCFGSCVTKGDNQSKRSPVHCSNCGHPGNKRDHMTSGCPLCENVVEGTDTSNSGCRKKTKGFQCVCKDCSKVSDTIPYQKMKTWI